MSFALAAPLASITALSLRADYDDDGDTDVFVCCDNAANQLWRNDGQGRFEEVAFSAGVAGASIRR